MVKIPPYTESARLKLKNYTKERGFFQDKNEDCLRILSAVCDEVGSCTRSEIGKMPDIEIKTVMEEGESKIEIDYRGPENIKSKVYDVIHRTISKGTEFLGYDDDLKENFTIEMNS